jgi:DNA-binding NarL/FixJ family response regulator
MAVVDVAAEPTSSGLAATVARARRPHGATRLPLGRRRPAPGHVRAHGTALRVVIAEDSLLLRAAMARLLDDAGLDVVGQAGDADDLLRKVRAHMPDVAIIDIRMPPNQLDEGLQAARVIRTEVPSVGILLLSQYVEARYALDLLEHGADGVGYLLKDRLADVSRFTDAIRSVAERGSVLDPEVVAHMLGRHRRNRTLDAFTERDQDVLAQMAEGATNRAIAKRMFLSERAVERHVTTIFEKLELTLSKHTHRRVLAVLAYLQAA